jgi:hypothetical protein
MHADFRWHLGAPMSVLDEREFDRLDGLGHVEAGVLNVGAGEI